MKKTCLLIFSILAAQCALAQTVVPVGKGSYASYAPLSKSRSDEHGGDQSRYMQYRPLHITERPGQPIPTNDWWTDMLKDTQTYSGHLWSYPQYVEAQSDGIDVVFPDYWIQNGTEMKPTTRFHLTAKDFAPEAAVADTWHDWDVTFVLGNAICSTSTSNENMRVTMAHGMPFTWVEMQGLTPQFTAEKIVRQAAGRMAIELSGTDDTGARHTALYGVYFPTDADVQIDPSLAAGTGQGTVTLSPADRTAGCPYVVIALLQSADDLDAYAPYALNVPRNTEVRWAYDAAKGKVTTTWDVTAENLANGTRGGDVLQGFIPHHYRDGAHPRFTFQSHAYTTPHGQLKLATGRTFDIDYDFSGMLPYYALPTDAGYNADIMRELLANYAAGGSFGADTYWGGKGLTQMALYMTFAREMGETELFRQCRDRLKAALVNWLTWTPGEEHTFFARDPRWGAMIGYNTSYDSETFNDHHFHYGYFTYAGALLALVDDDFRVNYGPMLREVAKDYANWERNDQRYPLFRTFDPWAGHSFAGGMGDGNGNGQESSSEAMQSWGGLYLLGLALGDDAMRDAGIFGWVSEARGTAEYWFDRHRDNIDYSKYDHPYNSNLTCHGVGWWNYFSGDQLWNAAIQWMPISPCLDYLSEDLDFARWDYETAWKLKSIGGWFDSNKDGSLGDGSGLGNVVLSYLQRHDPQQAADVFDQLWARNLSTAKATDTGGITYFVTHSHLTYGDIDWTVGATLPSARAYKDKEGRYTLMAYNPSDTEQEVKFYGLSDGHTIGSLLCPPRRLTVGGAESKAVGEIVPVDNSEADPRASIIMQNLALGRPCTESGHENAGTVPANATDGKQDTRWGSLHKDGEWIYVDLGRSASIYEIRINWEAAYAAEYLLEVSDDAKTWRPVGPTGHFTSGGGWDSVMADDAEGRYVRLTGIKRATQYGISFYELEVYGHYLDAATSDILGIRVTADADVLQQHRPAQLQAEGYTVGGEWTDVVPTWSTTSGSITTSGTFTPASYGSATVTATVGTMKASRTFPVEEAIAARALSVKPATDRVIAGMPLSIKALLTDQFGGPMDESVNFSITCDGLSTTDDEATITAASQTSCYTFTARNTGKYVITATYDSPTGTAQPLTASAEVTVCDFADVNLALGKPVSATSQQNNSARLATDGNLTTRWESVWGVDPQDLTVNLKDDYVIDRVVLTWEAAAAKTYDILVSTDGETWTKATTCTIKQAGRQEHTFAPIEARYVRIHGTSRMMTAYGYSLYELEVYGQRPVNTSITQLDAADLFPAASYLLNGLPASEQSRGIVIKQGRKTLK